MIMSAHRSVGFVDFDMLDAGNAGAPDTIDLVQVCYSGMLLVNTGVS